MKGKHVLIALAAFGGGLVVGLLLIRQPLEPLTGELLQAAKERWHAAGVRGYVVRYRLNADLYEVTVQDRIVTSIQVNGKPPIGTELQSFTVDGLFRVLELELENLTDPSGAFSSQRESILARVRFNPELGYVERYLRSSAGVGRPASMEMLEFRAAPDE